MKYVLRQKFKKSEQSRSDICDTLEHKNFNSERIVEHVQSVFLRMVYNIY